MRTVGPRTANGSIEAAERAFAQWRQGSRRGRIPDRLWSLATGLVRREGLPISRVSKRLRLDFPAFKQRLAQVEPVRDRPGRRACDGTRATRFVELTPAAGSGPEVVRIRVEGLEGVAMEIVSPVSVSSEVVRVVASLLR